MFMVMGFVGGEVGLELLSPAFAFSLSFFSFSSSLPFWYILRKRKEKGSKSPVHELLRDWTRLLKHVKFYNNDPIYKEPATAELIHPLPKLSTST